MSWSGAIPWIISIVNIAVVVVGWKVVSTQNARRERQKEIRHIINKLEELLEEILDLCHRYYALDGDNSETPPLAIQLRVKVNSIKFLIDRICASGLALDVSEQISLIRRAATGGSFDAIGRKSADYDGQPYAELTFACNDLVRMIDNCYFDLFPMELANSRDTLFLRTRIELGLPS
jgi:hypothetical protein